MPPSENIITFFKFGKLLTPEALKYLENKNVDAFLPGNFGLVVDIEDLIAREDKIRILKNITFRKPEISTIDVLKFYNSKYEKMKNIILSRLQKDFVSINKLDAFRNMEVFTIGIVRDIKNDSKDPENKKIIELEDSTGVISAVFPREETEEVELDDVIAISGVFNEKMMDGKKVIYPDVPLRQPTLGSGKACFVSNLKLHEAPKQDFERFLRWFEGQDTAYLLIAGEIGDLHEFESLIETYCINKKVFVNAGSSKDLPSLPVNFSLRNIISLSNPSMIEINGIKLLLMNGFNLKMLKKRHLGSVKPILDDDAMALEELPDIVFCGDCPAGITNYKATTIVSAGSLLDDFRPVIIDFATREHVIPDIAAQPR